METKKQLRPITAHMFELPEELNAQTRVEILQQKDKIKGRQPVKKSFIKEKEKMVEVGVGSNSSMDKNVGGVL